VVVSAGCQRCGNMCSPDAYAQSPLPWNPSPRRRRGGECSFCRLIGLCDGDNCSADVRRTFGHHEYNEVRHLPFGHLLRSRHRCEWQIYCGLQLTPSVGRGELGLALALLHLLSPFRHGHARALSCQHLLILRLRQVRWPDREVNFRMPGFVSCCHVLEPRLVARSKVQVVT